jgi:signal recognition particle subunit SEC65
MEEYKHYQTIWPNYIDSSKSIPEGRRIAKEHCCKRFCVLVWGRGYDVCLIGQARRMGSHGVPGFDSGPDPRVEDISEVLRHYGLKHVKEVSHLHA